MYDKPYKVTNCGGSIYLQPISGVIVTYVVKPEASHLTYDADLVLHCSPVVHIGGMETSEPAKELSFKRSNYADVKTISDIVVADPTFFDQPSLTENVYARKVWLELVNKTPERPKIEGSQPKREPGGAS